MRDAGRSFDDEGQVRSWPFFLIINEDLLMAQNKFSVGQSVDFDLKVVTKFKTSGPYQVMRVLPAEDARSQRYTIKSKSEAFERSANEYEIVATV